ncbi:glycosyltransferase family 25 protein [Hoeflea olei]|uniref:Glycosyl transferase family 25 domain-containing protein n=1 Tax=Hoeflea olei TaxID=1480615 RepID=A0A1C1YY60_9HYPH|nr:glycosyltransferase family 25 protein [Hoeflea olei]OCW58350.1 hypothetical protein AWJ14_13535 [Hoeflea olei]
MSKPGGIEAFIIHLARAEARRPQVERIRAASPVPAEVIDAVDGRALPKAEIDAVLSRQSLFDPPYPFELSMGEIGCFLSHRKVWREIVERGLAAGLVLEDDVEIDREAFARAFAMASEVVDREGYIQFQVRPVPGSAAEVERRGDVVLVRPDIVMLRTSAQLVSAAQAARLLELSERIDRPVDGLLQMGWVTGVAPGCVIPSGVSDRTAQAGGSTISIAGRGGLAGRLGRELRRFVYRRRIRACSARFLAARGGRP